MDAVKIGGSGIGHPGRCVERLPGGMTESFPIRSIAESMTDLKSQRALKTVLIEDGGEEKIANDRIRSGDVFGLRHNHRSNRFRRQS